MQLRQKFLKAIYPLLMSAGKWRESGKTIKPQGMQTTPAKSFYSLNARTNTGENFSFETLRGHWVLLVNTASFCGYTAQYGSLGKLQEQYPELRIIGFPSNDFGKQEPGSNQEIAEFCRVSYGVKFQLMDKGPVSGAEKQEVYQWLTDPAQNGWNDQEPSWNFSKYLINQDGELEAVFGPQTDPFDAAITGKLTSAQTPKS